MMQDEEWKVKVRLLLRTEISSRDISYIDLSKKLKSMGIKETPQNLSNKIARGTFSAIFMLQVLTAIGCKSFSLEDFEAKQIKG